MAKMKKNDNTKCRQGCGATDTHNLLMECKLIQPLRKSIW